MELSELATSDKHEEGAEMVVKDQFGKDTSFVLKLAGLDSKRWRSANTIARHRIVEAAIKGDKIPDTLVETIAEATIGWKGLTDGGKEVPFSKEAAKQMYESAVYIVDQADDFIGERKNFIGG